MKKILLFALFIGIAFSSFAQNDKMQSKLEATLEAMTQNLDLSDVQQQQIRKLYEDRMAEKDSRKDLDKSAKRENRKSFRQQIEAILTPEQLEKKRTLEVQRRKKSRKKLNKQGEIAPRQKGKNPKSKGQVQRMKKISNMTDVEINDKATKKVAKMDKALDLSEAQENKIEQLMKANLTQIRSIANSSIEAHDKKAKIKELRKASKADIKAVLTPEQLEKKEALKEKRKSKKAKAGKNNLKKGHPNKMQK